MQQNFRRCQRTPRHVEPSRLCTVQTDEPKVCRDETTTEPKLYDREEQEKELLQAYKRIVSKGAEATAEIVLVTGSSGTGKTALASSIQKQVESDGGFFICGKFDQLRQQSAPYAAFISAFDEFTKEVTRRGEDAIKSVREDIDKAVGSEVHVIAEAIPALQQLIGETAPPPCQQQLSIRSYVKGSRNKGRFEVAFRRFIRAICSQKRSLVLLLDDLQWADSSSLELLKAIVSPSILRNNTGLMVLGTCRGNEVSLDHPLSKALRSLEDSGVYITNIRVPNLGLDAITHLLADVLSLDSHKCTTLAQLVHQQTNGNAFFATQYIKNIQKECLDDEDFDDIEIMKDNELIRSIYTDDDRMVRHFSKRMRFLPLEVQELLQVASCLGNEFDLHVLSVAAATEQSQLLQSLRLIEAHSLISLDFPNGVGKFSHDKLQEAAYFLIPNHEKASFHAMLGRTLRDQLSNEDASKHLLLIVDLLAHGMSEIINQEEKYEVAMLCLQAGRQAAKSSAFVSALEYAENGIKLLGFRHWRDHYELSCDLYNVAAELAYCTGNHSQVDVFAREIVKNSRSFKDQLQAHTTRILSLGSRGDLEKAKKECLDVLRQHGEPFPRKASMPAVLIDLFKTRRMLQAKTEEDILNLPKMKNSKTIASMSIINLLYRVVMIVDMPMSPLVAFRLVRLTLKYGLNCISSVGFGFYASVLVRLGMVEEGCRYGRLAERLQAKYPANEFAARTQLAVWGNVRTSRERYRNSLSPLIEIHRLGLKTGGIETAMIAAAIHGTMSLYLGNRLPSVAKVLGYYRDLCIDYGQHLPGMMICPSLQLSMNLMGLSDDPLVLTGEAMDEEKDMRKAVEEKNKSVYMWMLHTKCFLATYLNEHEVAESLSKQIRKLRQGVVVPFVTLFHIFCDAINASALGRKSKRKRSVARKRLRKLREASSRCPENISNKVYLIEAELAACSGRYNDALVKYQKSIELAEKEGYINEQALACEKAGRMLLECGKTIEAGPYIVRAQNLYEQWGATAKLEHIHLMMDSTDTVMDSNQFSLSGRSLGVDTLGDTVDEQ